MDRETLEVKKRVKTISQEYVRMNKELHQRPEGYGGGGHRHAEAVVSFAKALKAGSILDYGAGQRTLSQALAQENLSVAIRDYDPAVPGIDGPPAQADLVTCTDVLEHIEPEFLDSVLKHLRKLALKGLYLEIATRPANKTLKDGRNAHLIIQSSKWWVDTLISHGINPTKIQIITNPNKIPQERAVIVWVDKTQSLSLAVERVSETKT